MHSHSYFTRREMLNRCGSGLGMLALGALLQEELRANVTNTILEGNFAPKAKSVIWLYMEGGPSGFDLFDPKPELQKNHGKRVEGLKPFFGDPGPLMASPYEFKQYGQSGAWVSNALPHITECVDDIAFIKSVHCESNSHAPAMYQMNTGYTRPGFPSTGSWVTYGLGTMNKSLPGFVVMPKQSGTKGGALNWGSGFLPGAHQGTLFYSGEHPILNLKRPANKSDSTQRAQLELARALNQKHLVENAGYADLEARIASFELAYAMQFEASEAVDLKSESEETKALYGIDQEHSRDYGTKLLMARRLVERGVRFIQAYPQEQWDAHYDLKNNHDQMCGMTDKPVAGLLKDLKRRGLLESTLVIWGGEFGRLPISEKGIGRDHNPKGFLIWMAGGGIKGGTSYGETDEIGLKAVTNPVSVPDVHATILHLLGMDHKKLTYLHNGRDFRLTDVSGHAIKDIIA